ncbi:TetR/AcrR family transcriptional regulator [Actinocorallia lasiicapitis]
MEASARVLYEQGVERTTIADIAQAADVPVGNVYYYFKTKDELIEAALAEHAEGFASLTTELAVLNSPMSRLKGLVDRWERQREQTARYGCPFGTLASELDKRADPALDASAAHVLRLLLDWTETQFRELDLADPPGLALTFVSAYQGMSVVSNILRDPEVMTKETTRVKTWLDSLQAAEPDKAAAV